MPQISFFLQRSHLYKIPESLMYMRIFRIFSLRGKTFFIDLHTHALCYKTHTHVTRHIKNK